MKIHALIHTKRMAGIAAEAAATGVGLATRVVADDEVFAAATNMALRLTDRGMVAPSVIKNVIR